MSSRLTKKQIEEGIEFVFDEAMRYAKMSISELRETPKEDLLYELPRPDGNGDMMIGKRAELMLRHISSEILVLNKLESVVTRQSMRTLLGKEIVQRFVTERRSVDSKQVDRLIAFLGRAAHKTCHAETHLIPCHLMFQQEPDNLSVGPITFRTRKSFRRKVLPAVRAYDPGPNSKWGRDLLATALHYYKAFKWVAEVPVIPADSEMSVEIALEATRAALNALHVCLGANATHKMVIGGPRLTRDRRGHLYIGPGDKLHSNISDGGPGQVGFGPGWSKDLPGSDARYYLDLVGIAVESAVDPTLNRPLSRRVLDAIYWFGEAVRETTNAARIVKYVTALERMLMTREHDDIANTVSDRCAAFCWIGDRSKALSEWKSETVGLYDLRSRLVHGDMSPLSTEVVEGVQLAAQISRMAILSAMNHFAERDGLRQENIPNKQLAAFFDGIVAASKARAAVPSSFDDQPATLFRSEGKMEFETRAKRPGECSQAELAAFLKFAQDSGEVSPVGLDGRIRAAERLIFCRHGGTLIGIAGIKHPVDAYRQHVSDGSGVALLEKDWPVELGWIFVLEPFRRKGASTSMVECALRDLAVPIFSTSRVENTGMHVILKGHRFAQAGKDYDSTNGDYQLRLFTRSA